MESVRFAGLEGDEVAVGTVVAAELSLHHPGLDADDLEVEAVIRFGSKVLDQASRVIVPFEGDGAEERSTWRGSFTVRASGGHRARFRVRPKQRRDVRPAQLGLHVQKWL